MNAQQYYDKKIDSLNNPLARRHKRSPIPAINNPKFHISAICGKAMAPLAGLLVESGFHVSGSDKQFFPPMSEVLEHLSIDQNTFNSKNVTKADIVIIGNALGPDNIECQACRNMNIPYISVAEALNQYVLKNRKVLVVSGTHGKTTTTGLLSKIFKDNNLSPGYLIGGVVKGQKKAYSLGDRDIFIIEGDEYDTAYFDKRPKFLHYNPHGLVVTSLELDHTDIYRDKVDYFQAFKFLVEIVPKNGTILLCADNDAVKLKKYTNARVITYGFSNKADIRVCNQKLCATSQTFSLISKNELLGEITTPLSGDYNCSNIATAVGLSAIYGVNYQSSITSVKSFYGMKKRQELVAKNQDAIILFDDFAHHPTAVQVTLKGLKDRYGKNGRIIAIFEPGSNSSRRKDFESIYPKSFVNADLVIIKSPNFHHNDSVDNFMDVSIVVSKIQAIGIKATFFENNKSIVEYLIRNVMSGDVLVTMSNGSFGNIQNEIIDALSMSQYS